MFCIAGIIRLSCQHILKFTAPTEKKLRITQKQFPLTITNCNREDKEKLYEAIGFVIHDANRTR